MAAYGLPSVDELAVIALLLSIGLLAVIMGAIIGESLARASGVGGRRPRPAVLLVKSPLEVELKDRVIETTRGDLIVRDGKELLVYRKPEGVKPVEVRLGRKTVKAYLVDSKREVFYTIPEKVEARVGDGSVKLHPAMVDPKTLAEYIASKSLEKLLKPMRVGSLEAVLYMALGGLMVLLMIFFVLPMLGYQVSIGGGGVFG
ncbi:hypothetical protein APE_0734 [Aeropyrum pernix ovoid virus 1]|uniref:Uncharacterized protein n=2 Tax=root TaxID=1 RepID=Q9YE35_AERPE|nr:hypothetical protein [Aeropyrum pernix]YP_009177668.1 hypothetical protein ASQ65_gp17 [Aeropyrum pernix ovoid virus 1]BAA79711.1 hypothetical protein APE_0734 [Aeropyrum pernix ovoid virus 1] [Aeropyrum pernix K1]CCD22158.1 TPA: hypothetical protein [Aeropyrum pernix ovoid virus 1]